ncbi:MAG: hypothetical protein R6V49_09415 [Bacteroidales bacterium]
MPYFNKPLTMEKKILFAAMLAFFFGTCLLAQNNPKSKFKFDFSERFRMVGWDNAIDLNDSGATNQNFTRMRTSLGMRYIPSENLELMVKITHEFRYYFTPSTAPMHWNEIMFDQLLLKLKNGHLLPGVLTLGRQNIMMGEGFVILDGNPGDGSRSACFNAVRYDWNIKKDHTLTGFYAYQPEEDFLPVINGKDIDAAFQGDHSYQLIEQSEQAAALYYNGNSGKANLQAYGIWKEIMDDGWRITPQSELYTLGARVTMPVKGKLGVTAEAAYQAGTYGDFDRSAWAGYLYGSYLPGAEKMYCPSRINLGGFWLSGDNINTDNQEGWDPLFSRWPKWSESYIYTSLKENTGKIAYWSNIASAYLQTRFNLGPMIELDLACYQLYAPEQTRTTAYLSGTGQNRGVLLTGKLGYKISKNLTGHLMWDHFSPGDFYFAGADHYNWARMELLFQL